MGKQEKPPDGLGVGLKGEIEQITQADEYCVEQEELREMGQRDVPGTPGFIDAGKKEYRQWKMHQIQRVGHAGEEAGRGLVDARPRRLCAMKEHVQKRG